MDDNSKKRKIGVDGNIALEEESNVNNTIFIKKRTKKPKKEGIYAILDLEPNTPSPLSDVLTDIKQREEKLKIEKEKQHREKIINNKISSNTTTEQHHPYLPTIKQTVIICKESERDKERDKRNKREKEMKSRLNSHYTLMADHIQLQNIIATIQLASYLYLDSTTIIQYGLYWLGEYNNRRLKEHEYFNDMINGILKYKPYIEINGHFGLSYTTDTDARHCLLLKFVGSYLHSIPHAHFTLRDKSGLNKDRENAAILKGFSYIINPHNRCFLASSTAGLKSEFSLTHFIYDTLLEEFFEPSFIIYTCYLLLIKYLNNIMKLHLFRGKRVNKKTVEDIELELKQLNIYLMKNHIKPLKEFFDSNMEYIQRYIRMNNNIYDDDDKDDQDDQYENDIKRDVSLIQCDCFDKNDPRIHQRMKRLTIDLFMIKTVIEENYTDMIEMEKQISLLWSNKSAYCYKQMSIRAKKILMNIPKFNI